MLDRASTFADPEIARLLKTEFIPVAIDQAYQRRQQDTEGDFYRKIAGQSPRNDFEGTTQGFYIATASGELLLYNNNRDPAKLRRLMQQRLADFKSDPKLSDSSDKELFAETVDPRYNLSAPEGGLVLRVRAKVLDGYKPTSDRWRQIFQCSLSRDNLWVTAEEHRSLVSGVIPPSLQQRIARFHLVDNTRGEPPFWSPYDIRELDMQLQSGTLRGNVHLENRQSKRGYQASLLGVVETKNDKVTRFDVVVRGDFWGQGIHRGAPGQVYAGDLLHTRRRDRPRRSNPTARITRMAARLHAFESRRAMTSAEMPELRH